MPGKSVLITGTSTGFGRLTAETLARAGHTVFATMRGVEGKNSGPAQELKDLAASENLALHVLELDVTSQADIDAAVASVKEAGGRLDALVNNAGIFGMGPTEAYTADQVRFLLETNVVGVHAVTRSFLPLMREQKSGLIVNISSGLGRLVLPGAAVYCASKYALEALTEAYRYDLAEHGIDVVSIEPGAYGTEIFGKYFNPEDEAAAGSYPQLLGTLEQVGEALGKAVQAEDGNKPQEIADTILGLVDSESGRPPLRIPMGHDVAAVVGHVNESTAVSQRGMLSGFGFADYVNLV